MIVLYVLVGIIIVGAIVTRIILVYKLRKLHKSHLIIERKGINESK